MSYLRMSHLTEYFGNTTVYLPEYKCLGTLGDIEESGYYDEDTDVHTARMIINGTRVSTLRECGYIPFEREVDMEEEGYDQLVPAVIQPYLPRTQYVDVKGQPGLLALNNPQHYKRSADNERYSLNSPYDGMRLSRVTSPWEWCEVGIPSMAEVGKQLDEYNCGILSSDLCMQKRRGLLELRWLGAPIGKVNDNLGVELHPLYRPHFEGLLAKTGAIIC